MIENFREGVDTVTNMLPYSPSNDILVEYLGYYQGFDAQGRADIVKHNIKVSDTEYKKALKLGASTFFKEILDPKTNRALLLDMLEDEYFKFGFEAAPFVEHSTYDKV